MRGDTVSSYTVIAHPTGTGFKYADSEPLHIYAPKAGQVYYKGIVEESSLRIRWHQQ